MNALARLAVGRPKHVLAAWFTVVGLLGLVGMHAERHLRQRADLSVAGSASARGEALAKSRFGPSTTIPILLEGPRSASDQQGHRLVGELQNLGLTVLAPWELGDQSVLRPKQDTTVLIVRSPASFDDTSTKLIPKIRADVDRIVRSPVRASVTGSPDIARGLHSATVDAVKRAELIAAPLLMIVLLFVFRSVVAASVPLFIGITTITAGRGILDLSNSVHPLDGIGLNLMVMMGLALGVDYALLLVSRFREELDAGADPREATLRTTATAGRTVLFAGIIIVTSVIAVYPFSQSILLAPSRAPSASWPRSPRCRPLWCCSGRGSTASRSGAAPRRPPAGAWQRLRCVCSAGPRSPPGWCSPSWRPWRHRRWRSTWARRARS